jgi:low affinity Fe/Cu permease
MGEAFHRISAGVACAAGSPWTFAAAVAMVVGWALLGPTFGYSDHWQLFINTGTTIATFLMLFVLQNTQNRDTKAINIKLDELLRAIEGARTGLAAVGDLSEAEIDRIEAEFREIAAKEGITSHEALIGLHARVQPERAAPDDPDAVADASRGRESGRRRVPAKRPRGKLSRAKRRA